MINWGVIGAGGIADRRMIPEGIIPSGKCSLAAVMDVDAARISVLSARYKVPGYVQVDDLLAHPGVDAVYIATPNYLHKQHVIAAAKAGKHVLVEKPIALTLEDAEAIIIACRENHVKLMVGYMMRFHAHHRWLKEAVEQDRLGQLVFGRAQLTCWYPEVPGAWRQDPALGGGGALIDMGSHCLDLLEMWMGPIHKLAAFSNTLAFQYPVDDITTSLLEFASGAHGVVEVNFNVPDDAAQNSLELRGTKGVVLAEHTIGQDAGGRMTAYLSEHVGGYDAAQKRDESGIGKPVLSVPVNMYLAEIEHMVDCITNDLDPINGGETALHNLKLIQLAYESARTGRICTL